MKYIHITSPDIVIQNTTATLLEHLEAGERVAWLLAGGSAIPFEAKVAQALQAHDTSRLLVLSADERYGLPGHADENYVQLMDAGFPLPIGRILTGASAEDTARAFGAQVERMLSEADFALGVFGVGADGHTTGIKPGSPAVTSTDPAVCYQGSDFQRLTITPPIIRRLDEAIIYAVGNEKTATLRSLLHETLPLDTQPAQVLKEVKTSTLYTDNVL